MNLQFLRYFCVLADELHFGKAAEKLFITQPPLSAAIKNLEDELGAQLFLRTNKKVELTREGLILLNEAKMILQKTEQVKSLVAASLQGIEGRVEVGLSPSLIYRGVIDAVNAFVLENPKIDVNLHELPLRRQIEHLERGLIDVGFTNAPAVPVGFNSWRLKDDIFVLCLPDNHPRADAEFLDLRELSNDAFIMFSREIGPENYMNMMNIFFQAGVNPRTVHRVSTWMSTLLLVSKGVGNAIVPASMAGANMSGVRFVPMIGMGSTAPAMMVWGQQPHASAQRFVECAQKVLEGQVGS